MEKPGPQQYPSRLLVKSVTWSRDSHGLYDYESSSAIKNQLKITNSGLIYRFSDDVHFTTDKFKSIPHDEWQNLVRLTQHSSNLKSDTYIAQLANVDQQGQFLNRSMYEKLWLVIRQLKPIKGIRGYRLNEGDVIRLARLKYRVIEINEGKNIKPQQINLCELLLGTGNSDDEEASCEDDEIPSFTLPCRICLSDKFLPDNPLISPCICDGSMKYIHLKCLQRWLRSKIVSRSSEHSILLSWKELQCELCQKLFPHKMLVDGRIEQLIDIPKPSSHYIILESLCKNKDSNRGLLIISLCNKQTLKIGRANDSDIRVPEISVSRYHADISFQNGHFYIEDHNSKFGTLVQIKRGIALDANYPITIQAGRSLMSFSLKKTWSIIPACFRSNNGYFDFQQQGEHVIYPINTGIPLSVEEPAELLSRGSFTMSHMDLFKSNSNVLYNPSQIGYNSSYEEDEDQGMHIPILEEVEVARLPDDVNHDMTLVFNRETALDSEI